jgi:hypothetical protein
LEPRRAVGMIKHGLSFDADDDGRRNKDGFPPLNGVGCRGRGGTIAAGSFSSSIENAEKEGIEVLGWMVPITGYDVQCLRSSVARGDVTSAAGWWTSCRGHGRPAPLRERGGVWRLRLRSAECTAPKVATTLLIPNE